MATPGLSYHTKTMTAMKPKLFRMFSAWLRRAMPRCYYSRHSGEIWKIELWPGDDQWRASLHLHWVFNGSGHWLCIFLPELT